MYKTCGKYVYETGIKRRKNCVRLSTIHTNVLSKTIMQRGKDLFTHLLHPTFPTILSTALPSIFAPVSMQFIPAFHTAYNYHYEGLKKGK